ncbi:MAG: hypothetical protein Q9197_003186 [Variospora fuerteventurae]
MLPWVLFLKLWWLVLPWSTLGYPQAGPTHRRTSIAANLNNRDSDSTINSVNYNSADVVDRRAVRPPPGGRILQPDDPEPDASTPLLWLSDEPLERLNKSGGPYGAYSSVGKRKSFDFEYPPFLEPKVIIVRGYLDDVTHQGLISIWVSDHFLGNFYIDVDKGFEWKFDVLIAYGFVAMMSEYCDPVAKKDCIYLQLSLHVLFKQHVEKKWLLFKLPHNDKAKQGAGKDFLPVPSAA